MGRYLENLRPLLTESQFEGSRLIVQAFADPDGPGPRVQRELLARQQQMDNWVYDWWLNDMYLSQPLCLPINVNPGWVFPPRQFRGFSDIARYASRLIMYASQYKDKLDKKELEVERATSREKGQPLCMAQYYKLFTSYRVPGMGKDILISTEPDGVPLVNRHVILACRNKFYKLELNKGEKALDEEEVASHVLFVLESGTGENEPPPPLGLLTSQRRDLWAEHRQTLLAYEVNRTSLEEIEKSLMVVCLDLKPLGAKFRRGGAGRGGAGFTAAGGRDETSMMHQMLHGGGSHLDTPNRWFDKTMQLVICNDGVSGLCYEHSASEAMAVIAVLEGMLTSCSKLGPSDSPLATLSSNLTPLQWTEPPGLNKIINEAARSIDNLIEDLDLYVYRYDGYGKNYIKSCNVSPDVYIQLALQLAHFKMYGKLVATYESASTRRFLMGRVDCIRSATWEALQWVSSMADPGQSNKRVTFSLASDAEKLSLWDAAVKKQTEVMVENILGQGIDVHLLGLREQTKLMNMPMDLFEDQAFALANHFALSTSQVATKFGFIGYGAVVADGYGASYNILGDSVVFCLSAFHSSQVTSPGRLAAALEDALGSMQTLLNTRS